MQTQKICPVFKLEPSTLYLVKELFDNVAVFPHEVSGRFNHSMIDQCAVYEVNGDEVKADTSTSSSTITAFGAYTGSTAQLPPRQPAYR